VQPVRQWALGLAAERALASHGIRIVRHLLALGLDKLPEIATPPGWLGAEERGGGLRRPESTVGALRQEELRARLQGQREGCQGPEGHRG
jgi:hypothetical protein